MVGKKRQGSDEDITAQMRRFGRLVREAVPELAEIRDPADRAAFWTEMQAAIIEAGADVPQGTLDRDRRIIEIAVHRLRSRRSKSAGTAPA